MDGGDNDLHDVWYTFTHLYIHIWILDYLRSAQKKLDWKGIILCLWVQVLSLKLVRTPLNVLLRGHFLYLSMHLLLPRMNVMLDFIWTLPVQLTRNKWTLQKIVLRIVLEEWRFVNSSMFFYHSDSLRLNDICHKIHKFKRVILLWNLLE